MSQSAKLKALWADPVQRARFLQHRPQTSAASRFPAFVGEPIGGCVPWLGAKLASGYGFINDAGRPRLATHVALERAGHPRPNAASFALHRCDNPGCVNHEHLFWGTQAENMADQKAKGRHWATVKPDCKHGHLWTPENTRIGKDGRKNCRTCERNRLASRKMERTRALSRAN